MKKAIIALALTLSSLAIYAQWTSYRNEVGTWNRYTQKWVFGSMNKANIPIRFYKDRVEFENEANSVFRIIEDLGEDNGYNEEGVKRELHRWLAYDNNGKRCNITMILIDNKDYDPLLVNVMYDDVLLRFYCKRMGVDRLLN